MQQTRHARRLYVGNLPLGVPDSDVQNFFNGVLNAILPPGYMSRGDQPVLNVKLMPDKQFGFIEFATMEVAAAATSLDNVTFRPRPDLPVSQLRLKRPNDFKSELVPPTMQAPLLNQQVLAQLISGRGENSHMQHQLNSLGPPSTAIGGGLQRNVADGPNKIFVGGLPYQLNDAQVLEILQAFGPVKSFNLVREPGSITSKGYAFCEYMDPSTTPIVVRDLHGLIILDKQLTVKSSTSDGGAGVGGSLPPSYAAGYPPTAPLPMIAPSHQQIVQHNSKILKLSNMVTREDVQDDAEYLDIRDDVLTECSTFGKVFQVIIPRVKDGLPAATEGTIFVEFETPYGAAQAKLALTGRKFADNVVEVEYVSRLNLLEAAFFFAFLFPSGPLVSLLTPLPPPLQKKIPVRRGKIQ